MTNTVMLKQANFMWVGTTPKTGAKFSPPDFGLFWGHGFGIERHDENGIDVCSEDITADQ